MMDTQETNLPKEGIILDSNGELEESQTRTAELIEVTNETETETAAETKTAVEAMATDEIAIADQDFANDEGDNVAESSDITAAKTEVETQIEETAQSEDDVLEVENEAESDIEAEKTSNSFSSSVAMTRAQIIERLQQVVAAPVHYPKSEAESLRQAYYKIRRAETDEQQQAFVEQGGNEKDFVMSADEYEGQLKALMSEYKNKRAVLAAEEERLKEANYLLKQSIIERMRELTEAQGNFNESYSEFRELQNKWHEVKLIPQSHAKELWRNFQLYSDRFYQLVRIHNQFRDYDYKKNLDQKTALCETVERLAEETDSASAFHQLIELREQWREIGPVSKKYRDSIWERFKAAAAIVTQKHHAHQHDVKEVSDANHQEKKTMCEIVEAIDYTTFNSPNAWKKKAEEIIKLREKWIAITVGDVKKERIYARFSSACNKFFKKKSEYYKELKKEYEKIIALKKEIADKAESLKESSDWKETSKAFADMRTEWQKIGAIPHKYTDDIWKQFNAASEYFFERKNREHAHVRSEENDNLEAKKALLQKIKTLDETLSNEDALATLRRYIAEWNNIKFVPYKEKDQLYKDFSKATNYQFDRLKVSENDRRLQQYRSNVAEMVSSGSSGGGKNKLYGERDRLTRAYERIKSELQTYENNIGFLNISSKSANGLMKEMERKMTALRNDMEVIAKKIETIDENLV